MHGFILVLGHPEPAEARRRLSRAMSITSQLRPRLTETEYRERWLSDLECGLVTEQPSNDLPQLFDERESEVCATLVFGEVEGDEPAASLVQAAYLAGGIDAVERLEGSFAAVVVDRSARRVHFTTDLIGHRGPSYLQQGNTLWVASSSLLLAATGLCSQETDSVSAASMIGADWSIGGKSLLGCIAPHDPNLRRSWSQAHGVETRASLRIDLGARLASAQRERVRDQTDRVLAALQDRTRRFAATQTELSSSLTAGLDSRAVLALLHSVPHASRWTTLTSGAEDALDVRVARRLAGLVGAEHKRNAMSAAAADDFEQHATLRAIVCNGELNSKQAMSALPSYQRTTRRTAGGTGGEIFRGFFYPYFGPLGRVPNDASAITDKLCTFRFRRLGQLPFADPSIKQRVKERLLHKLSEYQRWSGEGADWVDLLYLFERYGRWGSASTRCSWLRLWTPFESATAIREAFLLPAPVGMRCAVHALAIERHLPRAATWIPINGAYPLWLDHAGVLSFPIQQALALQSKLRERALSRFRKQRRSIDDARADLFRSNPRVREFVWSTLTAPSSCFVQLFGADGARKILEQHQRGSNHLQTLGFALGVDLWKGKADEARALANAAG